MWEFSGLACRRMSKSETLGELLKNETPSRPVGQTIEKRNPFQARWADH